MNLENVREILSIIGPIRKKSFIFYTGIMVWEPCKKYRCHERISAMLERHWENQVFSSLIVQMNFLMDQRINRLEYISNELS